MTRRPGGADTPPGPDRFGQASDVSDPLGDVAGYAATVREDLDALTALGYIAGSNS